VPVSGGGIEVKQSEGVARVARQGGRAALGWMGWMVVLSAATNVAVAQGNRRWDYGANTAFEQKQPQGACEAYRDSLGLPLSGTSWSGTLALPWTATLDIVVCTSTTVTVHYTQTWPPSVVYPNGTTSTAGLSEHVRSAWLYERLSGMEAPSCSAAGSSNPGVSNPIYPVTGSKRQSEALGGWALGGQRLQITYDTRLKLPKVSAAAAGFDEEPPASFGALWSSRWHKALVIQADEQGVAHRVQAFRGDGAWTSFTRGTDGRYEGGTADRLVRRDDGGWQLSSAAERIDEYYDAAGRLLEAYAADGARWQYV
jgi:hypothetical protein